MDLIKIGKYIAGKRKELGMTQVTAFTKNLDVNEIISLFRMK